ncbi:CotH kinase family protein [Arcticibacterium luteifluviistationis]|uniref:Spore coat protein CotH n=1 Tax=Arcticibacterium luteifluviistationis TaxID=1784714 RepID=A0A2Z4G937_9BACT|nr:CotH kinase family protein [Arcticibacterium luteifluviistationis]AWV97568.1 spore coat protein CotH [Arcticibacterium luteifluviistationis]
MRTLLFLLLLAFPSLAQVSSNLPLVYIDTEGKQIVDEPKVMAKMKLIYNGEGQRNTPSGTAVYDGNIGIEYRGSSSQSFPKKPFGFETWDETGEDIKFDFFGWPEESDWILYPSYNEKSLIHNVLTLRMAEQMGLYGSRTKYVELYLNGSYEGIYVFMEKVKRDKGRVDISKLEPDEESGEDLTGGYIIKVDKNTGSNNGSWKSNYSNQAGAFKPSEFFYEYPKDITTIQRDYIQSYIEDFEDVLQTENFADAATGYQQYIDMESFVLMTIVNEVAKNVDGYRISTFLYKDKNEKLKLGPPWDYDISYGNANYCNGSSYQGFSYNFNFVCPDDTWQVLFWWQKFLSDVNFVKAYRSTYDDLRSNGILEESKLLALIDELANEIKEAQVRNFQRWPILGQYVWPQPQPVPATWEGEVEELKKWIPLRLQWLDQNIPSEMEVLSAEKGLGFNVKAYPNPYISSVSIEIVSEEKAIANVRLIDLLGREIKNQDFDLEKGQNQLNLNFPENHSSQTLQLLKVKVGGVEITHRMVQK